MAKQSLKQPTLHSVATHRQELMHVTLHALNIHEAEGATPCSMIEVGEPVAPQRELAELSPVAAQMELEQQPSQREMESLATPPGI